MALHTLFVRHFYTGGVDFDKQYFASFTAGIEKSSEIFLDVISLLVFQNNCILALHLKILISVFQY